MDSLVLVLFHSYQSSLRSTGRGSRIPSTRGLQGSWNAKLAHFSHFFVLVALFFDFFSHLNLSCIFLTIFWDFGLIFGGFGRVSGRFWESFFKVFSHFYRKCRLCKNMLPTH